MQRHLRGTLGALTNAGEGRRRVLMRRCVLAVASAFLPIMLLGGSAAADVIKLKSGSVIRGEIIRSDEQQLMVDVPDLGRMSVSWDRIDSIELTPGGQIGQQLEDLQRRMRGLAKKGGVGAEWDRVKGQLLGFAKRLRATDAQASFLNFWEELRARVSPDLRQVLGQAEMGAIGTVLLVFLGIMFVSYCYFALCLQLIAGKIGARHGWMAWFPILNLFLTCSVGGRSPFWLVPLIAAYVYNQTVGAVLAFLFTIVLYLGIAEGRGKSPWLALLMFVPVINIIVWGYLAFSGVPSQSRRW